MSNSRALEELLKLVNAYSLWTRDMAAHASRGLLLVLAGVDPIRGDERDGYAQRVKAIDPLLEKFSRIYIVYDRTRSEPAIEHIAPHIWSMAVPHRHDLTEMFLSYLVEASVGIYVHSLWGLLSEDVRKVVLSASRHRVLDLHGAVPEELEMMGDESGAALFSNLESQAADACDTIVTVSQAMADHFTTKHPTSRARMIVCPIFPAEAGFPLPAKPANTVPRIVYSGGIQKWQKIPEMLTLIRDTYDSYRYSVFTPAVPETATLMTDLRMEAARIELRTLSRRELALEYPAFDFGLLLRDDSVVNRVSCPTKLIEYLAYGIVPVLDSPAIGDFPEQGGKFVSVAELRSGLVPDLETRRQIALSNWEVLRRMLREAEVGKRQVIDRLEHDFPLSAAVQ